MEKVRYREYGGKEMKIKSFIKTLTNWRVVVCIQLVTTILTLFILHRLNILPLRFFIIASVILLLLEGLMAFIVSRKNVIASQLGKVVSIILSILMIIVSINVEKSTSVLNQITNSDSQITRLNLIVMNDSGITKPEELSNKDIEYAYGESSEMKSGLEQLQQVATDPTLSQVENVTDLADDLYDGNTDAIFVNEAYSSLLEDTHETFTNDTTIIYSIDIKEDVTDFAKQADVTSESFNIFISGIDTTGPVSTISRSDVNMVVTVNPVTKKILMTSIPRDYYVTLANLGQKDKLTHAGLGGVENSVRTVENFLGIEINYYVKVNFTSLVEIVDALGGIDVESPVSFTTLHGNYRIKAGVNHLNGQQALGFVRERYALSGGDNDRVKNQQRVLSAMIEKAMSPNVITNYTEILDSISGSFETNMTTSEITSLIRMQLDDLASWDIEQIQLTGTGTTMTGGAYMPGSSLYYMLPDEESVNSCKSQIEATMAN